MSLYESMMSILEPIINKIKSEINVYTLDTAGNMNNDGTISTRINGNVRMLNEGGVNNGEKILVLRTSSGSKYGVTFNVWSKIRPSILYAAFYVDPEEISISNWDLPNGYFGVIAVNTPGEEHTFMGWRCIDFEMVEVHPFSAKVYALSKDIIKKDGLVELNTSYGDATDFDKRDLGSRVILKSLEKDGDGINLSRAEWVVSGNPWSVEVADVDTKLYLSASRGLNRGLKTTQPRLVKLHIQNVKEKVVKCIFQAQTSSYAVGDASARVSSYIPENTIVLNPGTVSAQGVVGDESPGYFKVYVVFYVGFYKPNPGDRLIVSGGHHDSYTNKWIPINESINMVSGHGYSVRLFTSSYAFGDGAKRCEVTTEIINTPPITYDWYLNVAEG